MPNQKLGDPTKVYIVYPYFEERRDWMNSMLYAQKELHSDLSDSCHLFRPLGVNKRAKFRKAGRLKYALTQILSQQPALLGFLAAFHT